MGILHGALELLHLRYRKLSIDLFVAVGSHEISLKQEKEQHIGIRKIIIHRDWSRNDTESWENDIALLILREKVRFPEFVRPICLPAQNETPLRQGEKCVVFGWGQREGWATVMPGPGGIKYRPLAL